MYLGISPIEYAYDHVVKDLTFSKIFSWFLSGILKILNGFFSLVGDSSMEIVMGQYLLGYSEILLYEIVLIFLIAVKLTPVKMY